MSKAIFSMFLSGLLFGSGPCIASCGPVLISYIAGTQKNISKAITVYILFSLARIFVYLVLGLLVFLLGRLAVQGLMEHYSRYALILGGCFIFLIGLLIAGGGKFHFNPCRFLQKDFLENDKKSIVLLGLIIGFLPCLPLFAILTYVGFVSKTWLDSLLYSFYFGLGTFLSPLILLAGFAGVIPKFLSRGKVIYAKIFRIICGLIIMVLGIQLFMRVF
jgi:sulfite exporter TauE/SafE